MMLIAMPKSAGTSLSFTLARLHGLLYGTKKVPVSEKITEDLIFYFLNDKVLFHLHIFPTPENVGILKEYRKVVLLRNPDDAFHAVERGVRAFVHSPDVLKKDTVEFFYGFYEGWVKEKNENTLIVFYEDLIRNPKKVVNEIEDFWDLPISKKVKLAKKRYTRSKARNLFRRVYLFLRRFKTLRVLRKMVYPRGYIS